MEYYANARMCSSCMTAIVGLRTASETAHNVEEWKDEFGFQGVVSVYAMVRRFSVCDSCGIDMNKSHTLMVYLAARCLSA